MSTLNSILRLSLYLLLILLFDLEIAFQTLHVLCLIYLFIFNDFRPLV